MTAMIIYFDRAGNIITSDRYLDLFRHPDYRIIASDTVADVRVATSRLGQCQTTWHEDSRPLIFGTILDYEVTNEWGKEKFSATEEEALEIHRIWVSELQGS